MKKIEAVLKSPEQKNPEQKSRVLIVDDEETVTLLLQKVLENEGYQVDAANSAAYALFLVNKQKYHIVLSDILMPDMDGLELLQEIRKKDPLIQVVMMTGGVTMSKTLTALELGAADFILKPLEMEEVLLVIRLCGAKMKRWQGAIRSAYHQRQQNEKKLSVLVSG